MALDATVAGSAANTYATQAEADTYYGVRTGATATAWAAALAPAKENALIVAAQMMECVRYFYRRWSDANQATPQVLAFPREHHIDSDNAPYVEACIKTAQIMQAGAIIASQVATSSGLDADTLAELRALGIDSVKIGTTNLSFGKSTVVGDVRKAELIELGFSPDAASILMRFVSKTGTVTPDAESLIRIGELRRIEVFSDVRLLSSYADSVVEVIA